MLHNDEVEEVFRALYNVGEAGEEAVLQHFEMNGICGPCLVKVLDRSAYSVIERMLELATETGIDVVEETIDTLCTSFANMIAVGIEIQKGQVLAGVTPGGAN